MLLHHTHCDLGLQLQVNRIHNTIQIHDNTFKGITHNCINSQDKKRHLYIIQTCHTHNGRKQAAHNSSYDDNFAAALGPDDGFYLFKSLFAGRTAEHF